MATAAGYDYIVEILTDEGWSLYRDYKTEREAKAVADMLNKRGFFARWRRKS